MTTDWSIIDLPRPQMSIKPHKWRLSTKASLPFTPEVRVQTSMQPGEQGEARCTSSSFLGAFLHLELHINAFPNYNKQKYYLSLEFHIQPQSPCPFGISPETSWLSLEIKPVVESILSQLINKSAGGSCKRVAETGFEEESDGKGKSKCGSSACIVSAVLVFSPGALWVWRCCRCFCSVSIRCRASPPRQNWLWCKQLPERAHLVHLKKKKKN